LREGVLTGTFWVTAAVGLAVLVGMIAPFL
jgi:hypothetical protein